ncbi:hypothetical protein GW17_00012436 [Ensete ventricosum]|nr:hypothetical protein GW17_00012436 [Ensete ventricosum]
MLCFLSFFCTTMSKTREEDEEIEADGANYQLEMMRCLREVNVDNNTVGWYVINISFLVEYQSTLLGSFQTVELIETFMNYQVMERSLSYIPTVC